MWYFHLVLIYDPSYYIDLVADVEPFRPIPHSARIRMSDTEKDEVKKGRAGSGRFYPPTDSPSPLVFSKKMDITLGFYVDNECLNDMTVCDLVPIYCMDE